jgi:hypothetical protein
MTITPITSGSGAASFLPNEDMLQVKNDFDALKNALATNNLNAAKDAYAALQADTGGAGSTTTGSSTSANTNMTDLGKALASGDINGAKEIMSKIQGAHGHHHHGGAKPAATTDTSTTTSVLSTTGIVQNSDGSYNV